MVIATITEPNTVQQLVELITTNGMSIVIIAYFLWRDYKYNSQLILLMSELKQLIQALNQEN